MSRKHKILKDYFKIESKDLMENQRKFTKEDKKNGFSVCETWAMDYSFVCWLAERLVRYKEIAGKVVDLEFHKFNYNGEEKTQLEMIDILIKKCEKYFKLNQRVLDENEGEVWKEIVEIWKLIGLSMWW